MIKINKKEDCCGCGACKQRCPKQCIILQEDHEGFLYPLVDLAACNDCGLCEKVCPVLHQKNSRKPMHVYAAKNKDEQIRKESSSGGIFTLLAEAILAEDGVVFGARFSDKWEVIHDYTETKEGLANFRGSKYVQSNIGKTFKKTEMFLKEGRKVLYSGTPCQIAGLKRYLRKEYDNLLTVDFVCHGVPSPKVFRLYLDEIINKLSPKSGSSISSIVSVPVITDISFRDKSYGWKKYCFVLRLSDYGQGTDRNTVSFSETLGKNIFLKGFLNNLYLRPSCHDCPSRDLKSGCDITIADYWTVKRYHPDINDDDKGISLIMIMNEKGNEFWHRINNETVEIQSTFKNALIVNPSIQKDSKPHKKRNLFFENYNNKNSIIRLVDVLTKRTFIEKMIRFQKRAISRLKRLFKLT